MEIYEKYQIQPYKSLFMETFVNQLFTYIKKLSDILRREKIDHTIIGGAALMFYDRYRTTQDIDVVINSEDKEKMENIPELKMTSPYNSKTFRLETSKDRYSQDIDVLYTDEYSGSIRSGIHFPVPKSLTDELPICDLHTLIELKLTSWLYGRSRYQDAADVVELIKIQGLKEDFAKNFREDLNTEYQRLWNKLYGEENESL